MSNVIHEERLTVKAHEEQDALEATHRPLVLLLHLCPAQHAAQAADAAIADVLAVPRLDLLCTGFATMSRA